MFVREHSREKVVREHVQGATLMQGCHKKQKVTLVSDELRRAKKIVVMRGLLWY